MGRLKKVELTWVGKDESPKLEPRILIEDPALSVLPADGSPTENMLIHGDNLLALKALEKDFSGKVKCIYIDPPYGAGRTLAQYADSADRSQWLSMMRCRLMAAMSLLTEDGSIWIHCDDRQQAYLRVMMDEIHDGFIATIVWKNKYSRENRTSIGRSHEYILVYAKDILAFREARNKLALSPKQAGVYRNPNDDPKGAWRSVTMSAQGWRRNQMYEITSPAGVVHRPPPGACWRFTEPRFQQAISDGRVYWGKDGNGRPRIIQYQSDIDGCVPNTWWPHEEVGHTDEAKKESQKLFGKDRSFETPKPERLIERILTIATNPADFVLDFFLGSGTTAAVAHKMGRRWIGIELGDHAVTHCAPRLNRVITGTDVGGITDAVGWVVGGGFRHYRLTAI